MDYNELWKILNGIKNGIKNGISGIPDHLTCLLRNMYAGEEARVRTGHGTTLVSNQERNTSRLYIVTLFSLYAEYIMRNTGPDEAEAGIKIARRNINNLRYADDTTFMAESKEELKSLLKKMKEKSKKVGLNFNIHKMRVWDLVTSLHSK